MSQPVITVDQLSKSYKIGLRQQQHRTFREAMTDTLLSPVRRLRSIAAGGNGEAGGDDTFWALKDVSFEVKQGEVVGIIGRNGAGKSTLLKILSRITEPTSGQVRMRGRVASLLEVGTGFHPELTGRENIYLNGAILGMKRAEITRKFDEIVAFAEVEKFLDTPVKRYSSGMYVRLAFAVAAHLEPEILIVDEVLAVGDAEFQKKCLGKLSQISHVEGRTVLFVSHNHSAILRLCSRAVLLCNGLIALSDAPAPVIDQYLGEMADSSNRITSNGSQPVAITSIEATFESLGPTSFGEPLAINVGCIAHEDLVTALEIIIRDEMGHPIIFLPSGIRFDTTFRLRRGGKATLSCRIPSLPLAEGRYYVDAMLTLSGRGILDAQTSAASFFVANADPGNRGRLFTQKTRQGCVHVDADFSMTRSDWD